MASITHQFFELTPEQYAASEYGPLQERHYSFCWREFILPRHQLTGRMGRIHGTTQMEVLDRLRECYPEIGAVEFIRRGEYEAAKLAAAKQ